MALRILLDQNVPQAACGFLRSRRPDWMIQHVADAGLWGATDEKILEWAQADGSIIVTFDEDFADARMFPVGSHCGVIRLRVWPTTIEETVSALQRVIDEVAEDGLRGSLVIVDETRIRVRRSIRHG